VLLETGSVGLENEIICVQLRVNNEVAQAENEIQIMGTQRCLEVSVRQAPTNLGSRKRTIHK
jgi:hypothetical protein